jgi:hypothetical protein
MMQRILTCTILTLSTAVVIAEGSRDGDWASIILSRDGDSFDFFVLGLKPIEFLGSSFGFGCSINFLRFPI